jgi:predicted dehydrogenase
MTRIRSLAIAGAWGYIGRKFVDAGLDLGLDVSALDPGPAPADVPLERLRHFTDDSFYEQPADLFHLALHPEHRGAALQRLLQRASHAPLAILNEKPMATPDRPQDCATLIDAVTGTQALLLFDFPELFDPLTTRVIEYLQRFEHVDIDSIVIQRSKDREDPGNGRNNKRMVHIQYQESVHCMAWILFVLGQLRGDADAVLADGVRVSAQARPYAPPNPQDYSYVVDGCVDYEMSLGATRIQGRTDFTRGAPWAKTRLVRGRADGQPFELDMDYLEGAKRLSIGGVDQDIDPAGSSYEGVIHTFDRWLTQQDATRLMSSTCYPNPTFARLTYQLSSLLWRSGFDGSPLTRASADDLLAFDAGFAAAVPSFGRYG